MWPSFLATQRADLGFGGAHMRRRTFVTAALGLIAAPATAFAQLDLSGPSQTIPPHIDPRNDLERTLVQAMYFDPSQREVFPHVLLRSEVAIAMMTDAPDSPPQVVTTSSGFRGVAVYTSPARLISIRGPATQQLLLTGREALQRYHQEGIVLNAGLAPYFTLDPDDITRYLAMSDDG
jgi:hypothetical protein